MSGDDLILQHVVSSGSDDLVNIVVKTSTNEFRILTNVNMAQVTDSSWSEFRPMITAQTTVTGFNYAD